MNLIFHLKGEYFDQIKAGTKTEEFRLVNDYWKRRLMGRTYEHIILTRGYPKRDDTQRQLVVPWNGWEIVNITHPHFGLKPVTVFAIDVRHNRRLTNE